MYKNEKLIYHVLQYNACQFGGILGCMLPVLIPGNETCKTNYSHIIRACDDFYFTRHLNEFCALSFMQQVLLVDHKIHKEV